MTSSGLVILFVAVVLALAPPLHYLQVMNFILFVKKYSFNWASTLCVLLKRMIGSISSYLVTCLKAHLKEVQQFTDRFSRETAPSFT